MIGEQDVETQEQEQAPHLISLREAARYLGVLPQTIRAYAYRKGWSMQRVPMSHGLFVDVAEVERVKVERDKMARTRQ